MSDERAGSDSENRVISLRTRRRAVKRNEPSQGSAGSEPPDLAPYQQSSDDDYRHRLITNVLTFIFCIFLVVAGVWLAIKIADMRKNQDCALSGRRNCSQVEVPVQNRW